MHNPLFASVNEIKRLLFCLLGGSADEKCNKVDLSKFIPHFPLFLQLKEGECIYYLLLILKIIFGGCMVNSACWDLLVPHGLGLSALDE